MKRLVLVVVLAGGKILAVDPTCAPAPVCGGGCVIPPDSCSGLIACQADLQAPLYLICNPHTNAGCNKVEFKFKNNFTSAIKLTSARLDWTHRAPAASPPPAGNRPVFTSFSLNGVVINGSWTSSLLQGVGTTANPWVSTTNGNAFSNAPSIAVGATITVRYTFTQPVGKVTAPVWWDEFTTNNLFFVLLDGTGQPTLTNSECTYGLLVVN